MNRPLLPALLALTLLVALPLRAQPVVAPTAATLYDIAYKGVPVTVDGDLSDWSDAQFIFLSQDKPNFLDRNGNPIFGVPDGPDDFSAYFAMKMDEANVYFAAIVRDDDPLIGTPDSPNLAFNYDHLSVYLGLYDIEDRAGSPHVEGPGAFNLIDPVGEDTMMADRSYRIRPGYDDTESTLGPDYQLLLRAVDYGTPDGVVEGDAARAYTYNAAYVDTTIGGTTAATQLFESEEGYYLEWKVPFESLAGKIASTKRPKIADVAWPLYEPHDGDVIVFDADVTDLDGGEAGNVYLRLGNGVALWQRADRFQMRGELVAAGVPEGVFVEDDPARTEIPRTYLLEANYPNPFNPETTIPFGLSQTGPVRLAVYDVMGREVAVLVDGVLPAGRKLVRFDAAGLPSGVYVYRLETPAGAELRTMLLVK